MKLLVVEDSAELRISLARALEGVGYLVDQAENGEDAAHLGATGDYAAVVLDLGLPLVDGLTVLADWRAHGIATPGCYEGWCEVASHPRVARAAELGSEMGILLIA